MYGTTDSRSAKIAEQKKEKLANCTVLGKIRADLATLNINEVLNSVLSKLRIKTQQFGAEHKVLISCDDHEMADEVSRIPEFVRLSDSTHNLD